MAGWARSDPARALAFAGGAGAALLLMPGAHRELDMLYPRRDAVGDGGFADGAWPGGDARAHEPGHALDERGAAETFRVADDWLDATGFDGLDAVWRAIDAAVGGGGGDGGGSGGGGDGGG